MSAAVVCAAAACGAAAAASSHTSFWTNKSGSANCGRRVTSKSFQLLCSAKGIPRPKHGAPVGDPFVVLGPTGKPQLVLVSQDEFPAGSAKKLADGTAWSSHGITCTVSGKVKCTNRSGHGFTIGNGKYQPF